jgi:hypothetical protein
VRPSPQPLPNRKHIILCAPSSHSCSSRFRSGSLGFPSREAPSPEETSAGMADGPQALGCLLGHRRKS